MRLADNDPPSLVLHLDRVEHNSATMARFVAERRADLRPHFKTPKCTEVARLQLAAGAIGITCAKLGEAEVIADAGLDASVLIANQIVGPRKVERLLALAPRLPELLFAVDDPRQIEAITIRAATPPASLGALVEVDIGMRRCGSRAPEQTVALAKQIRASGIPYRGIMGYEGHAVLIADDPKRGKLCEQSLEQLDLHRRALADAGLAPEIVSAGGTGTHDITGSAAFVTEVQAGSYVFMDGAYQVVRGEFQLALSLWTTVIHRSGRMLITDCGMKSLSHEFGMPRGATLPLECKGLSEEHGHVLIDEDADLDLEPGDRIALLPSHGDTTINLHDRYYVVRGERVEFVWPISGRGQFH